MSMGRPCPAAMSRGDKGVALLCRLPFVCRFRVHPRRHRDVDHLPHPSDGQKRPPLRRTGQAGRGMTTNRRTGQRKNMWYALEGRVERAGRPTGGGRPPLSDSCSPKPAQLGRCSVQTRLDTVDKIEGAPGRAGGVRGCRGRGDCGARCGRVGHGRGRHGGGGGGGPGGQRRGRRQQHG